jgi:hypothetical protein
MIGTPCEVPVPRNRNENDIARIVPGETPGFEWQDSGFGARLPAEARRPRRGGSGSDGRWLPGRRSAPMSSLRGTAFSAGGSHPGKPRQRSGVPGVAGGALVLVSDGTISSGRMTTAMRRFRARPSAVALSARGRNSPSPTAARRRGSTLACFLQESDGGGGAAGGEGPVVGEAAAGAGVDGGRCRCGRRPGPGGWCAAGGPGRA